MARGQSDLAQRRKLYEDIDRRLPEMLTALRHRAVDAGLAHAVEGGSEPPSPFGVAPAVGASDDPFDPFRGGT